MKRTIFFFALAVCAIALVSAQGNNRWGPGPGDKRHHLPPSGPSLQPENRAPNLPPRGPAPRLGLRRYHWNIPPQLESTSVSGNLTIVKGSIAVTSGDTTYLVNKLSRYIGFIDGLTEGAAVTLEGYVTPSPHGANIKILQVEKMTLNGTDYDLAPYERPLPEKRHWGRP